MKINETYHICRTGKLEQHFTLYVERTITDDHFFNSSCRFVQNLGFDKDESITKVEKMIANSNNTSQISFSNSKRKEYCNLEAFGLDWKKTPKGFMVVIDRLEQKQQQEIWRVWRKDKSLLREAGFMVFKGGYDWMFFFRNCSDEDMNKNLKVLEDARTSKVVSGNYLGELNERFHLNVTLKNKIVRETGWGTTRILNFETESGDKVVSFYSGRKEVPDVGTPMLLSGTVKKHQEYDGVKQTTLNRINF